MNILARYKNIGCDSKIDLSKAFNSFRHLFSLLSAHIKKAVENPA